MAISVEKTAYQKSVIHQKILVQLNQDTYLEKQTKLIKWLATSNEVVPATAISAGAGKICVMKYK